MTLKPKISGFFGGNILVGIFLADIFWRKYFGGNILAETDQV
jgi:hypothetical protein